MDTMNFIFRNAQNLSYSGSRSRFRVVDNHFKLFYGGCSSGGNYIVTEEKGNWLLSKCIDGCRQCKACTNGIWVEKSSGFVEFDE